MPAEPPRPGGLFALLLIAVGLVASACSTTTRHKVLTFFFDGVPSIDAAASDKAATNTTSYASGTVQISSAAAIAFPKVTGDVVHPPYQSQSCTACHEFGGPEGLTAPLAELCSQCHERIDIGSVVHWPVKQGRCSLCHDPHQSPNPRLLRRPATTLCLSCHNGSQLSHGPEMGACLDCHQPHSSNQAKLLKG